MTTEPTNLNTLAAIARTTKSAHYRRALAIAAAEIEHLRARVAEPVNEPSPQYFARITIAFNAGECDPDETADTIVRDLIDAGHAATLDSVDEEGTTNGRI